MTIKKPNLWLVPIEPLQERYTAQWYANIPTFFNNTNDYNEVKIVHGTPLSDTVNVGTFLDINSTVAFKNSQMSFIASMFHERRVENGDVFYFTDIEFWGIESLRLLAQMNGISIRIYGFMHAASHTAEDAFSVASTYQKYTELGWVLACDGVFFGTQYARSAFIERRVMPFAHAKDVDAISKRLHVTGNPLFAVDYEEFSAEEFPKKKQIIISNRFDWEKRPNMSLDFAYILKRRDPGINIIVTTSRSTFRSNKSWLVERARFMEQEGIITIHEGLTKSQYHKHLHESSLMLTNSIEESFGYCIVEALWYDCAVLAKNAYSHPELLRNPEYLYDDEDEILEKAEHLLKTRVRTRDLCSRFLDSLSVMNSIMLMDATD